MGAERLIRRFGVADLGMIAAPDDNARCMRVAAGQLPHDPERAAIEVEGHPKLGTVRADCFGGPDWRWKLL